MSRCFSYPPPGYLVSQGSSQALIESIKLQKESVLAKAETKKDRKREKKERRKEKKEKARNLLPEKKIHKSISTLLKFTSHQKLLQSENEQLERSSLTEEHAQPVGEQKPSTSSDSTQNSSKRKRELDSPVIRQEENSIRSNGNVIRIRLSSRKQDTSVDPQQPCSTTSAHNQELVAISRQEPCTTSGGTELATCNDHHEGHGGFPSIRQGINNVVSVQQPTSEVDKVSSSSEPKSANKEIGAAVLSQLTENELPIRALPPRPDGEGCSTSGEPKSIIRDDDISVHRPKSLDKKKVKAELRYRDLFLNWVPPPLQMELESDDQDWLFSKKKNPENQSLKMLKPSIDVPCASSSGLYPRAQFIPEADIYALPFTVPF